MSTPLKPLPTHQFERRAGDPLIQAVAHRLESIRGDVGDLKGALKEMASAMTKLALVEERQSQATISQERGWKVMEKLEQNLRELESRIDGLEREAPMQKQTSTWVLSAVWGVAGLAVMFIAKKLGLL